MTSGNGEKKELNNFTEEDHLGSQAVREATHATDKKSSSASNPRKPITKKKKSYGNQIKAINEINKVSNPQKGRIMIKEIFYCFF